MMTKTTRKSRQEAPGGSRRGAAVGRAWTRVTPLVLLVSVLGAGALEAQRCERGWEPRVSLGIGIFHCQGGSCLVSGASSTVRSELPLELERMRADYERAYSFSVEPTLWRIDPDGPAAGLVQPGDALVAVDGAPITTRRGGIHLSTMRPGEPLTLTLRRSRGGGGVGFASRTDSAPRFTSDFGASDVGSALLEVQVAPEMTCATITASAGPDFMPRRVRDEGVRRPPSAPTVGDHASLARFTTSGLVLLGPKEIVVESDGTVRWWFKDVPVVAEVVEGSAADRAGIRPGEEFVSAGGTRVTEPGGVAALAAAGPDNPVTVFVRHGTRARGVRLHEN